MRRDRRILACRGFSPFHFPFFSNHYIVQYSTKYVSTINQQWIICLPCAYGIIRLPIRINEVWFFVWKGISGRKGVKVGRLSSFNQENDETIKIKTRFLYFLPGRTVDFWF